LDYITIQETMSTYTEGKITIPTNEKGDCIVSLAIKIFQTPHILGKKPSDKDVAKFVSNALIRIGGHLPAEVFSSSVNWRNPSDWKDFTFVATAQMSIKLFKKLMNSNEFKFRGSNLRVTVCKYQPHAFHTAAKKFLKIPKGFTFSGASNKDKHDDALSKWEECISADLISTIVSEEEHLVASTVVSEGNYSDESLIIPKGMSWAEMCEGNRSPAPKHQPPPIESPTPSNLSIKAKKFVPSNLLIQLEADHEDLLAQAQLAELQAQERKLRAQLVEKRIARIREMNTGVYTSN
jgi:hypothetical protein